MVAALVDFKSRSPRSARRMEPIQTYCIEQLDARGLAGCDIEKTVRVAYKRKAWDVVKLGPDNRPQLAITCRSIISNHGGTVPNRIDDLLGEGVSLHRAFPNAVAGYLLVMSLRDERREAGSAPPARDWFAQLVASVTRVGGRGSPQDLPERFEAIACLLLTSTLIPTSWLTSSSIRPTRTTGTTTSSSMCSWASTRSASRREVASWQGSRARRLGRRSSARPLRLDATSSASVRRCPRIRRRSPR